MRAQITSRPAPVAARVDPAVHAWQSHPDDGARLGVLFVHGFTGNPAALRPWAERTADAGYGVSLPRLPGHGTSWREMTVTRWPDWYAVAERAYDDLRARYDRVVVAGLSMGGALALRIAEHHDVAGVVLVNPAIATTDPRYRALGVLRHAVRSIPPSAATSPNPARTSTATRARRWPPPIP